MRVRTVGAGLALVAALAVAGGCASSGLEGDRASEAVFEQPIEQVQRAAVDALLGAGFDVAMQSPTYVEGYRPRRMGRFVGGGETVSVWLSPQSRAKTGVRVDAARSMVGLSGQSSWDGYILRQMDRSLAN
jgi:hypothetical protein